MIAPPRPVTAEQFDTFIHLPENRDRRFELIAEGVVEVVSSNKSSALAARFIHYLYGFVDAHNLGHVTGPDGGYAVAGERYIPDVAYVSYDRQPQLTNDAYFPVAPDLAVEIVSPTDREGLLLVKVANYMAAGTTVWVVYPDLKEVHIYVPGQKVDALTDQDTLHGGDQLPGFSLDLSQIFR
jgi:Uma2 family endonuclease